MSAGARIPPAVVEGLALDVSSGSTVSVAAHCTGYSAVSEAPPQPPVMGDLPCVRFAAPPVTASSAPESAEGEDDDVASVVSIPR